MLRCGPRGTSKGSLWNRSRNDVLVTPVIFRNVSKSVVYKNSYDVDASLCRGSRHLKKDDWLECVCVCVDFSDVKCSYLQSFCFVIWDLLMSRLGQSSILEQRTSNWAVFQMDNSRVLEARLKKKGKLLSIHLFLFFMFDSVLFLPSFFWFQSTGHLIPVLWCTFHPSFPLIFIYIVQWRFSFLFCSSLSNTLSLFLHLSLTIGGMWAMLCMTGHKFQI